MRDERTAVLSSLIAAFMRLDLYLKASRLCPRRTVAQQLCEAGAVLLNGSPAKPSRSVAEGDTLALRRRDRLLTVRVTRLPASRQTPRAEAATLYETISEEKIAEPYE